MSLINDALKRAKQAQQQQQQAPLPPLMPPTPPQAPPHGTLNWLFPILLAGLIAAACVLIGLAILPRKAAAPTGPSAAHAQTAASAGVAPKTPAPSPVLATTPGPTQSVVIVAAPAPTPALKLQGIFYNSNQPQAIVNGKTVYPGDSINGFRVKMISKDEVSFIAPDGSEKTLNLSE